MIRWIRAVIVTGVVFAATASAFADDVPDRLAECRSMKDEAVRLACYDRIAGKAPEQEGATAKPAASTEGSAAAASAPSTQVPTQPGAAAPSSAASTGPDATSSDTAAPTAADASPGAGPSRADEFGYRGGALAREDSKKAQEKASVEPEPVLSATVTEIANRQGLLVFTLDNGQVWKQKTAQEFRLRVGDPVSIEPGILGAFMLSGPYSKRSTRVTRVR